MSDENPVQDPPADPGQDSAAFFGAKQLYVQWPVQTTGSLQVIEKRDPDGNLLGYDLGDGSLIPVDVMMQLVQLVTSRSGANVSDYVG